MSRSRLPDPCRAPVSVLQALGYDSYATYLKSEHWQEMKRRYRKSERPQICVVCGAKRVQLHHRTYRRLGKEHVSDLVPLCGEHHESLHLEYGWDNPVGLATVTAIYVDVQTRDHPEKATPLPPVPHKFQRGPRPQGNREQVRTVGCPRCGVEPGQPCLSKKGHPRNANHQARVSLFAAAT